MQRIMPYAAFRVSHHIIKYVVFVYLLLISKWKGVVTSVTDPPKIKYHVFLNFRGPDVREGFLSHLSRAFSREHIVFFIDDDIPRGDEISHTLSRAIEGSLIALVIFSPNYASSRWCLKELVKILECKKNDGQIVLPVFFKVDPSRVRQQRGTYGDAFAEHERKYNLITTRRWRSALKESANIAGFDSSKFRNEAELIEDIVKRVLELNQKHHVNLRGLNEIGKRVAYVESLLQSEAADVRIIGICGIGAIHKTAIAQEVYNNVCSEYEGCWFLANITEESARDGIKIVKQKLFSALLGEKDLEIDTPNGLPQCDKERIGRKKVLIVLDDVNDSELKDLVGTHEWFGSGSRIIITTRNMCVLSKEFAPVHEGIYLLVALPDVEENSIQLHLSCHSSNKNINNTPGHLEQNKLFGASNKTEGHHMQRKQKKMFTNSYVSKNKTETKEVGKTALQMKYDVFVSFRGADIPQDFISHLIEAFSQNQIATFVDYKIHKGEDELSEALVDAIEGSLISLVVFSENYASSRWCLLELGKIMECRKKDGQIVLPIFYKVDPSHVRHKKGTCGDAFPKHESGYCWNTLPTWKSDLKDCSYLPGFHSSSFLDEAELVKEIVKSVSMRLNHVHQVNSKGLVGIGKRIAHVESLLQLEAPAVRIIGIWGMAGIGKTTIAQEVYNKLCFEYEGCCFLANIREESGRHGMISLKKKLFSTLLGEDLKIDTPNGLPQFVERRVRCMKVLIILDDVNVSEQVEILAGTHDWFGSGSRIVITTRDKQVLAKEFAVYKVVALNFDESLRLFNLNAFKQNHLEKEYHELSKKVVNYAKGIPLVLKDLGTLLLGKDKKIWKSQLDRFKKVPSKKVHDTIKLSYNDLDQDEKKIFLDIACFFNGLNLSVKYIKFLLKDHTYSAAEGLERLKDKALISISQENIVSMHDIIQETAWQIASQESIEDPGSQTRLLDPDDIYHVLKYNKGNEAIRSILINLSRIKPLQLNPNVFTKMSKLHFLHFYSKGSSTTFLQDQGSLYFPQGLESLPNELRYLRWIHYPLESLPSNFSAENLVWLNLPHSRVKKLWQEVPDVVNLKVLILHSSIHLKELPNLSKATNLKVIDLRFCVGLTSMHPSVFSLNKLEKLYLGGCISLRSFQSNVPLDSLRYLSLHGCKTLKHFSVTSKNMVKLNLELTGIKQLSSSLGLESKKLEKLSLAYTYIENLPPSIKHLSMLRHLDLRHCTELQTLPELPPSLKILDASGCVSLESVMFPYTLTEQLKENKKMVAFWNCLKLNEQSLRAIEMNAQINMMKFAHQRLSTFGDAQGTYVYPGSNVPKWLEYKTTHDYVTVDLSSVLAPQGFIFGFIVPQVPYEGSVLKFNISIDGDGEGDIVNVYLDRPRYGIKSDHVYLMYDQACSRYLNSRVKLQPRLKIRVTVASQTLTSMYEPLQLRGFGVSTINTTQYLGFVQKVKVGDSILKVLILLVLILFLLEFRRMVVSLFNY